MTFEQLIAAARKAIADGDTKLAEQYTAQAKALKGIDNVAELAALRDFKAAVEAEPAHNKAGYVVVTGDEADRALEGSPFKSMGEFLMTIKDQARGKFDQRLLPVRSSDPMDEGGYNLGKAIGHKAVGSLANAALKSAKAPLGLNTGVDSAGGFLVGRDQDLSIMERVYDTGQLLQRIDVTGISGGSNSMSFNAEDETSRANGSRRGGIQAYWMDEAGTYIASRPKFRKQNLILKKVGALVYATDEQLADTTALESYIQRNLPEELRFVIEDALINGTGGGTPLGILNSGALVSISKETGQAAATIVANNIVKMWARRWTRAMDYLWLINQDVLPQLTLMNVGIGTAGQLVYMPPGGLSGAPYGTLYGRPVVEVEYCQTLGTLGDIMLVSPSQYQGIDKGGIQTASSIHVAFLTGEQVFRFMYRFDGEPKWNAALTPKNGSNTTSPFVALAARA